MKKFIHHFNQPPNKPAAADPAMALCLTIEDQWRRLSDPEH